MDMPEKAATVAIVDDAAAVRESLAEMLELKKYAAVTFVSGEDLLSWQGIGAARCFIVDIRLGGMAGTKLLEKLVKMGVMGPVIIMTGHGDVSTAVDAMKKGAYDFVEKPFEADVMLASVARAVEKANLLYQARQLKDELAAALGDREGYCGILGKSPEVAKLKDEINVYAGVMLTALVTGETGSGKELVARALHARSARAAGPFVALNMASIPESLAFVELFGCEKGAFTGADSRKTGKFEFASGGTLLLDEINSAPMAVQAGILRAIEEKRITRIGSNESVPVDVRIVAASNQDIPALAEKGLFRADLYHRLGAAVIRVPALRERREDIPVLAHAFLWESLKFYEKGEMGISPVVMDKLVSYSWPGNVRELKNTIAALALKCPGDQITDWEVPGGQTPRAAASGSLRESVNAFEKEFISEALKRTGGNLKEAAAIMEIPPRSLFDKMRKYGLDRDDFK
ncbi:MAG: sigma-54-dependent Fis family transcriptional regulator [Nitrospinae bacterium]|nr:sigma-54-dependent Fis family transcriptional regulator [Nitrospinota bacterium]